MEERLNSALHSGITGDAKRVVIGLNWIFVEGPEGAGLVHTPARGTESCRSLSESGNYQSRSLAGLATLTASTNIFESALGYAAINAHHNRFDLTGDAANGLDILEARGERTVVIGRFPDLDQKLPGAAVIEHEPGPGDYPPEAAANLLPAAEFIAITASTVSNETLGPLLELAPRNAFTILMGPSTPLCPALFEFGVDVLSGLIPRDLDATAKHITEGGTVSSLKSLGRYVTIRQQAVPLRLNLPGGWR